MNIILATKNTHKIREIQSCLETIGARFFNLSHRPELPEIPEDGDTFEENSLIKAREVYRLTGTAALADDSGLVVPAIGGEPGVHSARYAGENAPASALVEKLLDRMKGLKGQERSAYFECVMTLYREQDGSPQILTARGRVAGRISASPAGEGGFGYDPVFVPEGYTLTFAQMTADQKNSMSHRARALEDFLKKWSRAA